MHENILTGHKGYIGAVAAPVMCAAGHEVVGLDTDLFAGCEFGEPFERSRKFERTFAL